MIYYLPSARANMKTVAWVSLLSHNRKLQRWHLMQCIKESSTLRVSSKGSKPSPRTVYREGKEDEKIKGYLKYRRLIKDIMKKLSG